MRVATWLAAAFFALVLAAPARAASQKDLTDCSENADKDRRIAACTSIIKSRKETKRVVAIAHYNRGIVSYLKSDWDRAMADFNEAIRLNPKFASAYIARGVVWQQKGDADRAMADFNEAIKVDPKDRLGFYNRGLEWEKRGEHDRAIADLDESIRLEPKDTSSFYNRGESYRRKGEFDRAIADYTEALNLDPKNLYAYQYRGLTNFYKGEFILAAADLLREIDLETKPYPVLWRYLARSRAGQDGADELSANAARLTTKAWPYPVIDFFLGRRSAEEMQSSAGSDGDRCEAQYYLGQWYLLHQKADDAKKAFQTVAGEACARPDEEHLGAIAELKRMGE